MFFRKKPKPKLKQHIIDKSELVINGKGHPIVKLYTKFLLIVLNEHRFGVKKKEKIKQDNNVSVFELISYSMAKLIYYLEYNETDKKISSVYQIYSMSKADREKARKYDLIKSFKSLNKNLHDDYLAWENIEDLTNNRVEFYLSNSDNPKYIYETLRTIVENSCNIIKPINDISAVPNSLIISYASELLMFTVNMTAFDKDILTLAFEIVSEFLEENEEFGFETKEKWFSDN
jgi:hypothetical protein